MLGLTNLPTNQVSRRRRIPVIEAHGLFHPAAHVSDRRAPSGGDTLLAFVWTSCPLAGGHHLYFRA